jgi:hypothetical protein
MPVAHTYNPSYSGDSDQKDHQPRQMVHKTLSGKNPSQKRAGGVAQGVGPKFKPQYHQKKKKRSGFEPGKSTKIDPYFKIHCIF